MFMELNEMACIKSLEQSISLMNDNLLLGLANIYGKLYDFKCQVSDQCKVY